MESEVYDIFNKSGKRVGKATWEKCHTEGLIHKSACVLVFKDRSRKELLLQRRGRNMTQDPGLYQHSAGGHMFSGESVVKGAARELQEELFSGHKLPKLEIRKVKTFFNRDLPNNNEIFTIFETFYPGPFFHQPEELEEKPVWVSWEKLLNDVKKNPEKYTNAFRNILREYGSAGS